MEENRVISLNEHTDLPAKVTAAAVVATRVLIRMIRMTLSRKRCRGTLRIVNSE